MKVPFKGVELRFLDVARVAGGLKLLELDVGAYGTLNYPRL